MNAKNTTDAHCWANRYDRLYLLTDEEDAIIRAALIEGKFSSTTNSDLKRVSKVDLPAAEIGRIIARMRMVKLLDYGHISTGRLAAGSGRYRIGTLGSYFGRIIRGETLAGTVIEDLPPLPFR